MSKLSRTLKFQAKKLINPHYKKIKKRILENKAKYILAIQGEFPNISEVMLIIARLGGYKPTKNSSLPGIKNIERISTG